MILVPTRTDPLQDSRLARRLRRPRLLATGHHDCPPTGQDDCRYPGDKQGFDAAAALAVITRKWNALATLHVG